MHVSFKPYWYYNSKELCQCMCLSSLTGIIIARSCVSACVFQALLVCIIIARSCVHACVFQALLVCIIIARSCVHACVFRTTLKGEALPQSSQCIEQSLQINYSKHGCVYFKTLNGICHIMALNIERTVCHVTGSTCSLVHSSPQMPKTVALDG